jgi:hypothetical protein
MQSYQEMKSYQKRKANIPQQRGGRQIDGNLIQLTSMPEEIKSCFRLLRK